MSYKVQFWDFAKKSNSTKIPTDSPLKEFDCDIMDGSGIISPTIRLNTNFANPMGYTYCAIPALSRKYFVSNWTYDKGVYWAALTLDVLGTYKTEIGNLSLYVARSSYEMDGRIIDTKYPIKVGTSKAIATNAQNPFAVSFNNGYFVVGIINNDAAAIGAVSYYVFTNAQFRSFASFLLGNSSYLNSPTEISDSLLKCLVNPTQYIASCTWVPITPPTGAAITTIPIGWWSLSNMNCSRLSGYIRSSGTVTVQVPKHPDALTRGYYLLQEPYSTYYLDFPPFGAISLAANDLVDTDYLDMHWDVDCITGRGRLTIYAGPTGHTGPTTILHSQVGVPVALAQNSPDLTPTIQEATTISTDSPVLTGWSRVGNWLSQFVGDKTPFKNWLQREPEQIAQDIRGSAQSVANMANAAVASRLPVQVIGGNGGFMSGYYPIQLTGTFATITPDNNAEWGKPLCRTKQLNTIPGFIQCADADFEISCTAPERSAIADYLTGGFYYE